MDLANALLQLLTPWMLFLTLLGTALGIVVGAIPGLTGAMLIALTLPITYRMAPPDSMNLLVAMYTGSITGGLVSAILLRIPGTPSNVMTTFDGFPMALRGEAGRALGLGIGASTFGALFAWVVLATLTEPLANLAIRFSPFDYFALVLSALVLISSISQGSMLKGLLSGALGALIAFPGIDANSGTSRYTFDYWQLASGFDVLPVLVGVFAVGTILSEILAPERPRQVLGYTGRGFWVAWSEWRAQAVNLVRSSAIGTWIGILPGIGANVGSLVAYTVAKNTSKHPQEFGRGCPDGVVASEAANNATVGGALIPLIAMGIPGSVIDVFLMGAMQIHGIQPGPLLFTNNPGLVYIIIGACLTSTIAMFGLMVVLTPMLRRLLDVPKHYVFTTVLVFCVVGVFASNSRLFEVWVMLGFGVLGFGMERAGLPLGPFVLGFILAPLAEAKLRSGLMMTAGDITPLFTNPLSLGLLLVSVLLLVWPFAAGFLRRARGARAPHPSG
jgi:putative tricarboxylic transport membrane protein